MKVAIIPARGGSKRIPRKNIRLFSGLPMIAYAIRAARTSGLFSNVIVSTEDDEIAEVAIAHGAEVPFRRPAQLADDFAGTPEVVAHAIRQCADLGWQVDTACCIYSTVPLLQARYLQEALTLMESKRKSYCFPVLRFGAPIQRALKLTPKGIEMFQPEHYTARSQDLTPAFHDAGQFYWGIAAAWLEQRPLFSHDATAYVLPNHLAQDIDTLEDWERAERLFALSKSSSQINGQSP